MPRFYKGELFYHFRFRTCNEPKSNPSMDTQNSQQSKCPSKAPYSLSDSNQTSPTPGHQTWNLDNRYKNQSLEPLLNMMSSLLIPPYAPHVILSSSQFFCPLFYFEMSQNIVLFLKIKVINLLISLLHPYSIFKTI